MPEANSMFEDLGAVYPVGNALAGIGVIVTLTIEQLVVLFSHSQRVPGSDEESASKKPTTNHQHTHNLEPNENQTYQCTISSEAAANPMQEKLHHENHIHVHSTLEILESSNNFRELVSAYVLEISTAVHSIVIGFDLGILTNDDLSTIQVLFAALCFHQFIEGLGLGSVIKSSEKELGWRKVLTFIIIFSSTASLGVVLGISIRPNDESDLQLGLVGATTAIAAGSLLYIALVELTAVYFNLPHLEKDKSMKLGMIFLFILGATAMAIIGIWT